MVQPLACERALPMLVQMSPTLLLRWRKLAQGTFAAHLGLALVKNDDFRGKILIRQMQTPENLCQVLQMITEEPDLDWRGMWNQIDRKVESEIANCTGDQIRQIKRAYDDIKRQYPAGLADSLEAGSSPHRPSILLHHTLITHLSSSFPALSTSFLASPHPTSPYPSHLRPPPPSIMVFPSHLPSPHPASSPPHPAYIMGPSTALTAEQNRNLKAINQRLKNERKRTRSVDCP